MTKQELRQYRAMKKNVLWLWAKLEEMRLEMISPKIPRLTGMPHSSKAEDKMAEGVAKYIEASEHYAREYDEMNERLNYINACLDTLPPDDRLLMRYKYIDGLTWEQICTLMGYEWAQIHRKHKSILERIAKY